MASLKAAKSYHTSTTVLKRKTKLIWNHTIIDEDKIKLIHAQYYSVLTIKYKENNDGLYSIVILREEDSYSQADFLFGWRPWRGGVWKRSRLDLEKNHEKKGTDSRTCWPSFPLK